MSRTWRAARVFISSTFRDMHAEREELVKVVFPALRERLERHKVHLIDIDLRWGITEEQAEDGRTLDLCLQQIDECRPFFVGILGQRYGAVLDEVPKVVAEHHPWAAGISGRSITEIEIMHGALNAAGPSRRALFYMRDPSALDDVAEDVKSSVYEETDLESARKLAELKQRIRESGCSLMESYPARWESQAFERATRSRGKLVGLERFARRVEQDLWAALAEELALEGNTQADEDPRAEESHHHDHFAESRLRAYVGRDEIHRRLLDYVESEEHRPLCVTGPAGSGKSAILARLHRALDGRVDLLVPHFVGASAASTSLRRTLQRFCRILASDLNLDRDVADDVDELCAALRRLMGQLPDDRTCVLIVDAVDQFDEQDRRHALAWLPRELPKTVRIVLSATERPGEVREATATTLLQLHVPSLAREERSEIVRRVPALWAKTLDTGQVGSLLDNPAAETPLFLLVALEELRAVGSFREVGARIRNLPRGPNATAELFDQVLERLEGDFDPELVREVLVSLSAARRGLSEMELKELSAPLRGADDLLPVLRQLRPYLQRRGKLIDFSYRQLREGVRRRYLTGATEERRAHAHLAEYFHAHGYETTDGRKSGEDDPDARKTDELAWQRARAEQLPELVDLLTDCEFLTAKIRAYGPAALLEDLGMAQARLRSEAWRQAAEQLSALGQAVASEAHVLRARPRLAVQQVHNALAASGGDLGEARVVLDKAVKWLGGRREAWFRLRRSDVSGPRHVGERRVLSNDGDFSPIAIRPALGQVAAARRTSLRTHLELWDIEREKLIVDLGETGTIAALGWTPDGRYLQAVLQSGQVRIYDADLFRLHSEQRIAESGVLSAALAADGLTVGVCRVSDGPSAPLIAWSDLASGAARTIARAGRAWNWPLGLARDGSRLASVVSADSDVAPPGVKYLLCAWELRSKEERRLFCHPWPHMVKSAAFDHAGRHVAYGDVEGSVVVVDADAGRVVHAFAGHRLVEQSVRGGAWSRPEDEAHNGWVQCLAFSPDGSLLLSGDGMPRGHTIPGEVCLWDLATGRLRDRIQLRSGVESLVFNDQATRIVAGGQSFLGTLPTPSGAPRTAPAPERPAFAGRRKTLLLPDESVLAVAIAPDGESRALATGPDIIVETNGASSSDAFRFFAHAGRVRCLDWSPAGDLLASGGDDGACRLSRVRDGSHVDTPLRSAIPIRSARFSPDGRVLAVITGKSACALVSLGKAPVRELHAESGGALAAIAFSQDGRLLAAGGAGGVCTVWDTGTGNVVSQCRGHARLVHDVQFTSSGYLATASEDGTCRVWDVHDGSEIARCVAHESGAYRVFSHESLPGLVFSASHDKTFRAWGEMTGAEVGCLPVEQWVRGVSVSRVNQECVLIDAIGREMRFCRAAILAGS